MDDSRTEETLDALADLFLTEPRPTGTSPTGEHPVPGARSGVVSQLSGPAPIRLAPKRVPPRAAPGDESSHEHRPQHDEGPRLRLYRGDDDIEAAEAAALAEPPIEVDAGPVEAMVEATLLGNLPGFGGPWLTQYGQLLANEHGPVAILHVDDERVDAELIQPASSNALSGFEFSASPPAAAVDGEAPSAPVADMLNVLLRLQPTPVRLILVNLLGLEAPDTIQRLGAMKLWTLLTGSDDMAIAAGCQLVKKTLDAAGRLSNPPLVGLVVMGSDEPACKAAASKVNAQGRAFLRAPAPLVGHLKQMGPVNVKQLGSFTNDATTWSALTDLFEQVMPQMPTPVEATWPEAEAEPVAAVEPPPVEEAAAVVEPAPPPVQVQPVQPEIKAEPKVKSRIADAVRPPKLTPRPIEPKPKATQPPPVKVTPLPDDWSPFDDDVPRMKPRRQVAVPAATVATMSAPVADAKTQARPRAEPVIERVAAATTAPASPVAPVVTGDDPDLVGVLLETTAGALDGAAIEARCPRHGAVQFMVDATGQLHLLKRHCFERDGNGDGVRRSLLELIETEAWTREHRQLIALASRPHGVNLDARPRLHLFTDRADLVTPLIGRTDLPLKLHLLQEVDLPSGSAWYCTALS